MTSVNVEQSQLSRWVLGLLLVSMVVLPSRLWAAPETMELFSSGGSTTAQGPTLANQTNTYRMNPDNPTANTQVQVFPNLSVTYSFENQQFTGTGTDFGMTFGTSTTGIREIYIPHSGQGSPANTDFSSSRLNAANPQGIDVNANYGTRIEVRAGRLNGQSRNTTGVNGGLGYYFGDVVLTWNRPVLNPVINVSGLGGTTNGHGISAQLQLFSPPSGTTISLLSGRKLGVSGFNITNTAATLGPTASNGGAAGSIQVLNTNPISSLRFRVYLRTDTTSTLTTWQPTAGDAIVFSGSSTDAIVGDLFVSKTNNVSSLTSGSSTTYTVTVTNNGPSTIDGAVLTDSAGSGLSITGVSCSSLSGNRCTTAPTAASLTGSGVTLPSLASGQSYQLLVTGNVTALSSVSNSATVSLPTSNVAANTGASCVTSGGITRTFNSTTGACTSTDTDTVSVGSVASPPAQCVAMLPQTVGNASQISGQVVQLTPDAGSQIGAAWSAYRADLTQPFDFSAYVNVGSKDVNGADGLTFVFHNDSRGFTAIGQSGRSIGAGIGTTGTGGITPSFIIEFDTYNNGDNGWADPVGDTNDHAAVYLNGDSTHAANSNRITVPLNIGNIEDGQWREMRVVWNPTTQTLTYYLGGALIYSGTVNLQGILGTSQAYWGYTASTGGFTNQHQVCNINLPPSPVRLQVNKTSNGPWTVGQSGATYNLAVRTQTGTTVASSSTLATTVRDVLPTGITPNWTGTLTTNGWSCTFSGQNVTCTQTVSLAANGAATSNIVLPVQVGAAATAASPVTNYASVGGGGDSAFGGAAPTPGVSCTDINRCSSVQTTVTQNPVVADPTINEARFTIVPDLPTIYRGGTGTQLVTITNNGPSNATGTVATFIPAPQTGVTVTAVSVVGGGACTFSAGQWSCPVGNVANGANFQLSVTYSTTSAAALGTAQQATIRVNSNEFNPGSGVGETLYKVWGTNELNEVRPNGAFWVGYTGTGGSAQVGANSDENTPIINAWPAGQASPTGAYLTQAAVGIPNSVYGASSTTASPMIQRIVTNMSTDPNRTVTLPQLNNATQAGDNRRAWEYRTGIYVPTAQSVTLCVGNTSVGIDDGAYIVVDGVVQGIQDSYVPGGFVSASLSLSAGYHSISYRIVNQNTYSAAGDAESAAGGYGAIGISLGGTCNTANFDAWTNTAVPASINIVDGADLQITKTNSVTTVDAGGTTAYSVVVTNAGPSAANGAFFRDAAATGLTKTTITCTAAGGAVCPTAPIDPATVEGASGIAIPTLPSGGSVTFTVNANVTATSGSVSNVATTTVPAGVTELNTANNSATDTDTVNPRADLSISKTNSVTAVNAGSSTVYSVVISNAGPSAANGATFRDAVATGLNKTSITCSATGGAVCPTTPIDIATVEGASGIAIPTLPNGGSLTFTVTATVTAISGSVANTATITAPAGVTEINTANNTATDTDTVTPAVDLSAVKSQRAGTTGAFQTSTLSVLTLGTVQYQLVFTNNGPSTVTGATLADTVPAQFSGVSVVSATGSNGATACSASNTGNSVTGTWSGPSGAVCTVLIQATAGLTTGTYTNTASTAVPSGTVETNTANNSSSVQTAIAPAADLAIVKTQRVGTSGTFVSTPLSVFNTQVVQYQLVLTNNGPTAATNATYSDAVPANLTGLSVVGTPTTTGVGTVCATPTFTGQTLNGTFTAPQNGTCTIVIQGTASSTGSVTNTATVTAVGVTDTVTANNSSSVDLTITAAADLTISKTNSVSSVTSGTTTAYTVVVTNNGPNAANNASFQDPAVTGLSKTTITCTASGGAGCPTAPINVATVEGAGIAIPTLPSGGSVTFTVNASVTAVSGNVTNTATVSTPAGVTETNTANNSASDTDAVVLVADLSVTKTDGVSSVNAGGSTSYTVVVTNNGPSAANGAIFQDAAASGLSKTTVSCVASGGAVCPVGVTVGQIESGVAITTLPSGGSVTFTIGANVTATSGSVANTATITAPAGTTDNVVGNNSATDTNTVNPIADLSVTKTDGVSSVNAGGSTSYTVVVTNNGPSAANGATFQDAAASGLSKTTVSCVASGGAVCPVGVTVGQIESGVAITTLPSGGSVTFTIGANVTATSGSVANTATITAPAGTTDNVVGNNSATDTDTVIPSVSISGRVFTDNSGTTGLASNAYNATQEAGEVGLANSTIRLTNCAGSTIDITKTNAVGDYAFAVLQSQLSSPFCIEQDNLAGYTSVSGTTGYARATDTITVSNTGALSYSNHNFGDARLGLILTSDGQQTTTPGGTVSYPHILRAESVLTPTLTTSTTQQPNNAADQLWTTVLYRDSNCNGVIDPSETPVGSLGTLLPNQDICVVQRVNAPTNASNGAQHVASLSASYVTTVQGGAVLSGNSDTRKDTTLVGTGGLDMSKQVRVVSSCPSGDSSNTGFATQNTAKNGQFLEYQILYKNRSTRNLSEVVIRDVSPTNTLFKSAQCQVTPAGSSCAVEAMPAVDSTGNLRWRTTGPVAPNAQGAVRFCVQVPQLQ